MNLFVNTADLSFRCVVYGNPFYISVVAPGAAIMLANLIVLIMVIIRLHRSIKRRPMNVATRVITEARRAFGCNILLGTTWVFAFFAVEEVTMLFQWLFCVTSSLQGFFIFFFHVVRNQDVRNAWLEAFGKDSPSRSSQPKTSGKTSSKGKKGKKIHFNFITKFIILKCFSVFYTYNI